MNVKFLNNIAAEVDVSGEISVRTFSRNEVVKNVQVDKVSANFSNLFLDTGETVLAISNKSFETI